MVQIAFPGFRIVTIFHWIMLLDPHYARYMYEPAAANKPLDSIWSRNVAEPP